MNAEPMPDQPIIDAGLLSAASGALGVARLAGLLVIFEARLAGLGAALMAEGGDRAALVATLHQSRGSAVSLGFSGLERALAHAELWLAVQAPQAADGTSRGVTPGSEAPDPSGLCEAVREAWRASLAAAVLQLPELRHHRPFGSSR